MYFLAIDIGASSGRHILGHLENNKLCLEEIYRFKNGLINEDGILSWDVTNLFNEIIKGLIICKKINKIPNYIGIDTWACDYALLDRNDNLIGKIYCYRDNRTKDIIDLVHDKISFSNLYNKTGIQFQPFNTIYQLYHDKVNGKLKKAKTFLMLPDYLNFLLTNVKCQEYTNATSTGLVNRISHTWDSNILNILDYPTNLFKELTLPGEIIGDLKEDIINKVGFKAKVILPATHDTASATLAVPSLSNDILYISSGTWSLLGSIIDKANVSDSSLKANYSNEGSINYQFRYQKNIMGLWIIQQIRHELNDIPFKDIINLAKESKINGTIDVNDDCFLAPKSMIKAIKDYLGYDLETKDLIRVVYNSLVLSYDNSIKELENNLNKKFKEIYIIGGGSQDNLLNELTANKTKKQVIAGPVEATSIGNIIMQMIGAKEIVNFEEAKKIIKNSFKVEEILND